MDQAKVDAMTERIVNDVNGAMSCLNVYLGHRLGLFEALADSATTLDGLAARGQACHALPVLRHERIEEHETADRLGHLLGDAGNDGTAIGVADQHDVVEALPLDHVDDVGDVSGEIDPWRRPGASARRALSWWA